MNTSNQRSPKCGPRDAKIATCCFIGCDKPATKHIYTPPWTYDNYTHSCDDHVDDLKATDGDVIEPIENTL